MQLFLFVFITAKEDYIVTQDTSTYHPKVTLLHIDLNSL